MVRGEAGRCHGPSRIEESYEPNFDAKVFFPDWTADVVREHGSVDDPEPLRRGLGLAEAQHPQLAAAESAARRS
jgi:hypothetical protein